MNTQGLIELGEQRVRDQPDAIANPQDVDRPELLDLRLGVAMQAGARRRQQDLEREDAGDVRWSAAPP